MAPQRRTLVSVDLDDLACYHGIHGLDEPPLRQQGLVLERCLPRFLELFAELGIRATFFVVGRDLARDLRQGGAGARLLQQALGEGHELGNHSYAHAYDLARWGASSIRSDLEACNLALRDLGADVRGFRAPGYIHNAKMLQQVRAMGYAYDSSALPSLPYYVAKVAVIASMAATGRKSQALLGGGRSFLGPRQPHFRNDVGLWELPISVEPVAALPLIGTSMLAGPPWAVKRLRRRAVSMSYFHLELHGLDLSDPDLDGYPAGLVQRQPELQVSLGTKRRRLRTLLLERGPTTRLFEACEST